jgi:hypothetical protein
MAFLLDLPPAARAELAGRWGVEATTVALYQAMTGPRVLDAEEQRVLARLARESTSVEDLLAALPISRERLIARLDKLGALGLVLRVPPGDVPPRPARAPFGGEKLYVPSDVPVG